MNKPLFPLILICILLSACAALPEAEAAPSDEAVLQPSKVAVFPDDFERVNKRKAFQAPAVDHYPAEGVKGVYISARAAGKESFLSSIESLLRDTALNAMVIDFKDDFGKIVSPISRQDPLLSAAVEPVYDAAPLMKRMHGQGVYTIARIVTFRDNQLAEQRPDWTFQRDGKPWRAPGGHYFLNPFIKEVWDYQVNIAMEAAKAGFDEIQFDYVRFPGDFNRLSKGLSFSMGEYAQAKGTDTQKRAQVIADFLRYAREKLKPYGARVSADVFGYIVSSRDGNIGQDLRQIASSVDAVSAMIYPSHWGDGSFGAAKPDLEPYKVVKGYIQRELSVLSEIEPRAVSRPWLQAFTARYLGEGNYMKYTEKEIQAQVDALREAGVREFLLWNPACTYPRAVNYE